MNTHMLMIDSIDGVKQTGMKGYVGQYESKWGASLAWYEYRDANAGKRIIAKLIPLKGGGVNKRVWNAEEPDPMAGVQDRLQRISDQLADEIEARPRHAYFYGPERVIDPAHYEIPETQRWLTRLFDRYRPSFRTGITVEQWNGFLNDVLQGIWTRMGSEDVCDFSHLGHAIKVERPPHGQARITVAHPMRDPLTWEGSYQAARVFQDARALEIQDFTQRAMREDYTASITEDTQRMETEDMWLPEERTLMNYLEELDAENELNSNQWNRLLVTIFGNRDRWLGIRHAQVERLGIILTVECETDLVVTATSRTQPSRRWCGIRDGYAQIEHLQMVRVPQLGQQQSEHDERLGYPVRNVERSIRIIIPRLRVTLGVFPDQYSEANWMEFLGTLWQSRTLE